MVRHPIAKAMRKPEKPTPEYPLFAHANGRWAKKIKGRLVYFGRWDDPAGALAKYERQRADLEAGRRVGDRVSWAGVNTKVSTTSAKPYPEFPLFGHATGRWAKKIRGRLHYFGPVSDPDGALARYQEQRDDLHAGRMPLLPGPRRPA